MEKLVSILIPSYNAEKWIKQAIDSALAQTWPNKEIIIVDDGSRDNSLQIGKRYESGNVKVISQKNCGAAAARNRAYMEAQGGYIQWLDADDLLAPDKISRQINASEYEENSRILLSSAFGLFYYRTRNARFIPTALWADLKPVDWIIKKFNENAWMNPGVWLVSRKLAELAGPWDERLSLDDDGEYFSRVVVASDNIRFVSGAKCYYRISNPKSYSKDISERACESLFLSINLCIGYLRSLEDTERTRSACLNFLRTYLFYFYPEHTEILTKAKNLANELGGELNPPILKRKYDMMRKILGWKRTKIEMNRIPMIKELVRSNWDKFLYTLSVD